MSVLPNQLPGLVERYGLTRVEVDRSAWVVDQAGHRWEGAAALNRILDELGGGWALIARPYELALVADLEEAAYRWLARNRGRLHRLGMPPEVSER